jgi:hypothetical protein
MMPKKPRLDPLQPSLDDEIAREAAAQLTIDGNLVHHTAVIAEQDRIKREERERELRRKREEAEAQRLRDQPMDAGLMTPLFDE